MEASGRLEAYVNNALTGAEAEAGNWAGVGNARTMSLAQLRDSNARADDDRWVRYLMRPKQPSLSRQLASGAVSGLAGNPGLFKI